MTITAQANPAVRGTAARPADPTRNHADYVTSAGQDTRVLWGCSSTA